MKKILSLIALLICLTGVGQKVQGQEYFGPKAVCHWYLPYMSEVQADGLNGYDIIILHNELIYKKSAMLDYLLKQNPEVKLFTYINPVEIFVPQFSDSPWSKKIYQELSQENKTSWWLKQPDGNPIIFWVAANGYKTNMLNMSSDCPPVNGEIYADYIARRACEDVLSDSRISGALLDNVWGYAYWLSRYGENKGLDFNQDGIADTDSVKINLNWRMGTLKFIKKIRELKGPNFILISNPGESSYTYFTNGKQLEDFPFQHLADTLNGAWNINMINAVKAGEYSILNAKTENWFFGLCSAMLLDKVSFSVGQNMPFKKEYKISLGQPLGPAITIKEIEEDKPIYSRSYEKGIVFVEPKTKKSWIIETE